MPRSRFRTYWQREGQPANEGSTIQALREISSAEAAYQSLHGTYGTLDQLAAEQLIDGDIAAGTRHGYKFKIDISNSGSEEPQAFEAVGVPVVYPNTGRRSFYVDETGVIRAADARGADATRFDSPLDFDDDYHSGPPPARSYDSSVEY